MEFLDKLTKKASETYKGAAEKTSKFAKETKLKMKISDNKSKIDDIYEEIGRKVYQKHILGEDINIKTDLEEECKQMDKEAKYCPKCGTEQPEEVKENDSIEVEFIPDENIEKSTETEEQDENKTE